MATVPPFAPRGTKHQPLCCPHRWEHRCRKVGWSLLLPFFPWDANKVTQRHISCFGLMISRARTRTSLLRWVIWLQNFIFYHITNRISVKISKSERQVLPIHHQTGLKQEQKTGFSSHRVKFEFKHAFLGICIKDPKQLITQRARWANDVIIQLHLQNPHAK